MATEQKLSVISLPANADLSAKQYYILKGSNSSGTLRVDVAGVDDRPLGVLQNVPNAAGRAAEVGISGVTKVILGGSVTANDALTSDTNGKAITNASGDAFTVGVALVSGSAGDIISMLIQKTGTA